MRLFSFFSHRLSTKDTHRRTFRPLIESLEGRQMLSAAPLIISAPCTPTSCLTVTIDGKNNVAHVSANGGTCIDISICNVGEIDLKAGNAKCSIDTVNVTATCFGGCIKIIGSNANKNHLNACIDSGSVSMCAGTGANTWETGKTTGSGKISETGGSCGNNYMTLCGNGSETGGYNSHNEMTSSGGSICLTGASTSTNIFTLMSGTLSVTAGCNATNCVYVKGGCGSIKDASDSTTNIFTSNGCAPSAYKVTHCSPRSEIFYKKSA